MMKKFAICIVLILILTAFRSQQPVQVLGLTGAVSNIRIAVKAPGRIARLSNEKMSNDIDLQRMALWAMNDLIRTPRKEMNFEPVFQCYPMRCPPVPEGNDVVVACDTDVRLFWEWYFMREISGSQSGKEVEAAFHKRILEYVQEYGTVLAHPGSYNEGDVHKNYKKEEYAFHVWGATKILFALAEDYRRTHNTESREMAQRIMLRLNKNAIYTTWNNTIDCLEPSKLGPAGVYVNLSFNRTSPWGRVVSFLPIIGRLTVQAAVTNVFFLRPPHWALRDRIHSFVNEKEVPLVWSGAYIRFEGTKPGDELTITYPLIQFAQIPTGPWKERMKPVVELTFDWIGNTIVKSSPPPEGTPLFNGIPRKLPNPPLLH